MYTDQPAGSFAINQSVLTNFVSGLGRLYYPQGVLFEVWLLNLLLYPLKLRMQHSSQEDTSHHTLSSSTESLQLVNTGVGSCSRQWERLDGGLHHSGSGKQLGPVRQHADDAAGRHQDRICQVNIPLSGEAHADASPVTMLLVKIESGQR